MQSLFQSSDGGIERGDFVFIIGGSGSGKSTLIKMLYREEKPSRGEIILGGVNVGKLRNSRVYKLRRLIGVVFQEHQTAPDNEKAEQECRETAHRSTWDKEQGANTKEEQTEDHSTAITIPVDKVARRYSHQEITQIGSNLNKS